MAKTKPPVAITSCLDYNVDDIGPLAKKIKIIIIQTEQFIVFLDENEIIQWYTDGYQEFDAEFGAVANNVSYWESIANRVFSKKEAYDFKCLLAEAYARILDDKNVATANAIIDTTVQRLKKNGCEILKQAYILNAIFFTTIVMAVLVSVSIFKSLLLKSGLSVDSYEVLLTSLFGGIGAFVFVVFRFKSYSPEIEISKSVHKIDGLLRIFYGLIAGLIISIAIKSNVVFGFLQDVPRSNYLSFFLGIVAGASDLLIPNLVKQIESKT